MFEMLQLLNKLEGAGERVVEPFVDGSQHLDGRQSNILKQFISFVVSQPVDFLTVLPDFLGFFSRIIVTHFKEI